MKRYWDLSKGERAKLSEEQVETLLKYELMEKGLLEPEPMKLEPEEPVAIAGRRVYSLREGDTGYGVMLPIAFETIEAAEEALAAITLIRESGYQQPILTRRVKSLQVVAENLPTAEDAALVKIPFAEQQRRATANAAERRRWDQETEALDKATQDIWEDWKTRRQDEVRFEKIRQTLAEYERMTDGNRVLAGTFLEKVFDAEDIAEALQPNSATTKAEARRTNPVEKIPGNDSDGIAF